MYCSFATVGHVDMMRSAVSSNCLQSALTVLLFVIFLSQGILFVMPDSVQLLLLLLWEREQKLTPLEVLGLYPITFCYFKG
jgi:hypothetical protein